MRVPEIKAITQGLTEPRHSAKRQAGYVTWAMLLLAALIHAVVLFVEGKGNFDRIGVPVVMQPWVTSYVGDVIAKSSDAFRRIGEYVFIFSPSPNVEKFSSISYSHEIRALNCKGAGRNGRIRSNKHPDSLSRGTRKIEIVWELFVSQARMGIKKQGSCWSRSPVFPNWMNRPPNRVVSGVQMGDIWKSVYGQIGAQLPSGGFRGAIYKIMSGLP